LAAFLEDMQENRNFSAFIEDNLAILWPRLGSL